MKNENLEKIKELRRSGQINMQQYRTYKGQILSGNEEAAMIGLRRKGLIPCE